MTAPKASKTTAADNNAKSVSDAVLPAATDAVGAAANAVSEAAAGFTKTFDETVEHLRSVNEEFIEAAKQTGNLSLDTYEQTLGTLLELEERIGTASQFAWVSELTQAHVSFVTQVSRPLISAARDALR